MYSFISQNDLLINEKFFDYLKGVNLAEFQSLIDFNEGHGLKKNKFRSIVRIERKGKTLYLKRHFWPWKERIKSIIPLVKKEDARNEWKSILLLDSLGFNTMVPVAFGEKKKFGLPYLSLTLTEHIYDAEKFETYLPKHFIFPLKSEKISEKRILIKRLAALARDFHSKGLNHQDFYLGHLFIRSKDNTIFIIDLQRVHRGKIIRMRDRIKDLAQIAYSAKSSSIFTRTDFIRFACSYFERNKLNRDDKRLVKKINVKAEKISRHDAKLQLRKKKVKVH